MKYRFFLPAMAAMFFALFPASGQTGLYTYGGGYFVRNGKHWEEYRPDSKLGVWATYEQYAEDENFYSVSNSFCVVSVPKTSAYSFFYAKPGDSWTPIYTTREVYEYVPDRAKDIYCYKGGYFIRDGLNWYEYRPGERHEVWNSYVQTDCDGRLFYLKSISGNFWVGIPMDESVSGIYMKEGDGDWKVIYTLSGIYDSGRGFGFSIPFGEIQFYDSEEDKFGDSRTEESRVSFSSDGTGEIRYSDRKYPFSFLSYGLNESSDLGGLFYRLLFGSASDGGDGFVLYADDDSEKEVVSYSEVDDDEICTVSGIPGLPTTMFSKCGDPTIGYDVHERIEEGTFSARD